MQAEKFRRQAEDCVKRSQDAITEADKALFLGMADTWLRLARQHEARDAIAVAGNKAEDARQRQGTR